VGPAAADGFVYKSMDGDKMSSITQRVAQGCDPKLFFRARPMCITVAFGVVPATMGLF
jgi:hypothetical protein